MKMFNRKAQTGGLITSLVFGIASLVIGIIIAFVIVSTLTDADLLTSNRNSGSGLNEAGHVNNSGYLLTGLDTNYVPGTIVITSVVNNSITLLAANYTVNSTGTISNITTNDWHDATINYTFTIYSTEELATDRLSANFTEGVDNVSKKVPTVLLVAAIVLILGVLAILVGVWQKMRIGGGAI